MTSLGICFASLLLAAAPLAEVELVSFGQSKIMAIKHVREARPGLGLKAAKDLVESAPVVVLSTEDRAKAEALVARLNAAGATARIKPSAPKTEPAKP